MVPSLLIMLDMHQPQVGQHVYTAQRPCPHSREAPLNYPSNMQQKLWHHTSRYAALSAIYADAGPLGNQRNSN